MPLLSADNNRSPALRLTRGVVLAWIIVNAATPILYAIGWTALYKDVRPDDPSASWLPMVLGMLGLIALTAPLLLQVWVLRRAAPALCWLMIVPAIAVAGVVAIAAQILGGEMNKVLAPFPHYGWRALEDFRWQELAGLPWFATMARAGAVALIGMFAPAWIFARAARVRWSAPLLGAIGASMVVTFICASWMVAGVQLDQLNRSAMNGWGWGERASALVLQATLQAIWAAVAVLILGWRVRKNEGVAQPVKAGVLGASVLVCALLAPGSGALLAQGGMDRLYLAVQRTLSPPPAEDVSEGESLLQYALTAKVRVREVPRMATVSPDGRWIVTLASDRQIVVIDAATGAPAHRFTDVLEIHESPAWAWSSDSRLLALRTRGEIVKGQYVLHQARLAVYALPDFTLAGEYRHIGEPCLSDTHVENTVLFEQGGDALWLTCGLAAQARATDLLALRLALPQLTLQAERRYGDAAPWALRGLKQMDKSVWSWHVDQQAPYARFRDLTKNYVPVILQPPPDGWTARPNGTLQDVRFDEAHATIRFRACLSGLQCMLVYDMRTGAFLSQKHGAPAPRFSPWVFGLQTGTLRIEGDNRPTSRAGELVVMDTATGKVRQRIQTVAQEPMSISANGQVLATYADGDLRIYRILRPSGF